jgi:hypothetical protein
MQNQGGKKLSNKKKLFAIIAAVAMLAGMLAFSVVPGFAGTTATVTALSVPAVQTSFPNGAVYPNNELGTILINGMGVTAGENDTITVAMPGGVTLGAPSGTPTATNNDSVISIPEMLPSTTTPNAFYYNGTGVAENLTNVKITNTSVSFTVYAETTGTAAILISTPVSSVSGAGTGPINVYVQDTNAIVPAGNVQIGTIVSPGTITTVSSTASLSQGSEGSVTINVGENTPDALEPYDVTSASTGQNVGQYYEIKLPTYFEWTSPTITSLSGGWTQAVEVSGAPTFTNVEYNGQWYDLVAATQGTQGTIQASNGDWYYEPGTVFYNYTSGSRELYLYFGSSTGSVGFLQIGAAAGSNNIEAQYNAPSGNIVATVEGTNLGVTPASITIGTCGQYNVTTTNGTGTVILGQQGQTLPSFSISESVAGTLIQGRSITLTLPSGCYWTPTNLPIAYTTTGSVVLSAATTADLSSNEQALTYTVQQQDTGSTPSTIEFQSGEIDVDTSATVGPLNIQVSGSGINETVQAGTITNSVTATPASNPLPSVVVGQQNQPVSNFTITETAAGNFEAYNLWIVAPNGVTFNSVPTVSVTSGDLAIGAAQLSNYSNGINNEIIVPITTQSSNNQPGTISVKGLSVNLDTSVPTGQISLEIGGPALVDNISSGWPTKGISYPSGTTENISGTFVASVPVANVVNSVVTTTPSSTPSTGHGSATFTVGATVYSVNNVQYVMDVAPYISNGRTFVPVRYLGDALGAQVSWDASTQTVTLTRGSDTETLTIGSTTMTVNGTAETMDVAPVIVNGRTMLPARWVAQGFGAQVGWNPATQEVLITW